VVCSFQQEEREGRKRKPAPAVKGKGSGWLSKDHKKNVAKSAGEREGLQIAPRSLASFRTGDEGAKKGISFSAGARKGGDQPPSRKEEKIFPFSGGGPNRPGEMGGGKKEKRVFFIG